MKKYINSVRILTALTIITLAIISPLKVSSENVPDGVTYDDACRITSFWTSIYDYSKKVVAVATDDTAGEVKFNATIRVDYIRGTTEDGKIYYKQVCKYYIPYGVYDDVDGICNRLCIRLESVDPSGGWESVKIPKYVKLTEESKKELLQPITDSDFRKVISESLEDEIFVERISYSFLAYNKSIKNLYLSGKNIDIGPYCFVHSDIKNIFIKDGGSRYFDIEAFRGVDLSKVTLYFEPSASDNGEEPYTRLGFKEIIRCDDIETSWNEFIKK